MASKTEVAPQKEEVPEKEGPETPPDSPLLDLSDAAVKKLVRTTPQLIAGRSMPGWTADWLVHTTRLSTSAAMRLADPEGVFHVGAVVERVWFGRSYPARES